MRIGAFQFHAKSTVAENLISLKRGITLATEQGVKLLLTQECALSGYPPLEVVNAGKIDFEEVKKAIAEIQGFATQSNIFIALGTVLSEKNAVKNSIVPVSPEGTLLPPYSKRALWGWDKDNFSPGIGTGIYTIDGLKIGTRICYEIRFPEYFRELFMEGVDIALVSFCDVSEKENKNRYNTIQAHLITRAVENSMYLLSANSISKNQTAPTCLINPDGVVLQTAPGDEEYLLWFDYEKEEPTFGRKGRIEKSKELLKFF